MAANEKVQHTLNNLSSKIKKVYIELHNYSFFHGPSEVNATDRRFIGREKIIKKLKSVLENTETKSGAYLITGYRGMGKSSFVSKTLSEISAFHYPQKLAKRFGRIWLFSIIALLIINFSFDKLFFNITAPIAMLLLIIMITTAFFKPNQLAKLLKPYSFDLSPLNSSSFKYSLMDLSLFKRHTKFSKNYHIIFQEFLIALLIIQICLIISLFTGELSVYVLTILMISLFIFNYIEQHNSALKSTKSNSKPKTGPLNFLRRNFRKYYTSTNKVFIKVNLSYDDLEVRDILKLISRYTYTHYKEYKRSLRRHFLLKLGFAVTIFILTFSLYYSDTVFLLNQRIKKELKVYQFFPSQLPVAIFSENNILDSVANSVHDTSHNFYKDYLSGLFKKNSIYFNSVSNGFFHNKSAVASLASTRNDSINATTLQKVFINIDLFLYKVNINIRKILDELTLKFFNLNISRGKFYQGPILLYHLDYFFIFYYIFIWSFFKLLFGLSLFKYTSHRKILGEIKSLNELIDSQITLEKGMQTRIPIFDPVFNVIFNKKKVYEIADEREIEKKLIGIFNMFERLPSYIEKKPDIVFVFDELDKIEPHSNFNISEKEKEEAGKSTNRQQKVSFTPEGTRQRQEAIFKLFSNLKYFLTTAKAKFIFIAGRELYDASLADVSDRNFFIGSIFHQVIYVDSFLSDDSYGKLSDITSMTEEYVCRFLFPQDYIQKEQRERKKNFKKFEFTLKSYNKYLIELIGDDFNENFTEYQNQNDTFLMVIARQKREKVILLLKQFINYLTHVSNGSPKKITAFFESFIEPVVEVFDKPDSKLIVQYKDIPNNLFLSFDYQQQQKLGMIYYLTNPIVLSISNSIKEYGDKLLVSVSFLTDHLFKFHRNAFSWRNLEHTPEIIDINKTPELRNFMSQIVNHLLKTHLEEIVSGLYQYKFSKKVTREINYISKISEDSAAAFNFTLDESLAIKQHYQGKLIQLEQKYRDIYRQDKRGDFVNSVSSIHMVLGDLHYYDEEYSEAITEYQDSIQFLKDPAGMNYFGVSELVLLIRNMLKLGLAFEKRKTFNTAFVTYGELSNLIIKFREVKLEEFGLEERIDNTNTEDRIIILKESKNDDNPYVKEYYQEVNPLEVVIDDDGFSKSGHSLHKLSNRITPKIAELLFKISSFESVRLVFQPLLAQLHVLEKGNLGGVSPSDVKRIVQEFKYISKMLRVEEKYIITSEFYNKLGDILFFKNGLQNNVDINEKNKGEKVFLEEIAENKTPVFSGYCILNRDEVKGKRKRFPCWACNYYNKSLDNLLNNFLEQPTKKESIFDPLIHLLDALKEKSFDSYRSNSFKTLAKTLSNLANTYLSCLYDKDTIIEEDFIKEYFSFIESKDYDIIQKYFDTANKKYKNRELPAYLIEEKIMSIKHDEVQTINAGDLKNLYKNKPYLFDHYKLGFYENVLTIKATNVLFYVSEKIDENKKKENDLFCLMEKDYNKLKKENATRKSFVEHVLSVYNKGELQVLNKEIDKICKDDFLKYVANELRAEKDHTERDSNRQNYSHKMHLALIYYYLSAIFYKKAGEFKEYSFQLSKVLYVFQDYIRIKMAHNKENNIEPYTDIDFLNTFKKRIKENIVKKAIKGIYLAHDNIHRFETKKMKEIFNVGGENKKHRFGGDKISLNRISINDDIEEINLVYANVILLLAKSDEEFEYKRMVQNNIVSAYNLSDNVYNRVLRLHYKTLINYHVYSKILKLPSVDDDEFEVKFCKGICALLLKIDNQEDGISEEIKNSLKNMGFPNYDQFKHKSDLLVLLEHVLTDSIFCHHEIIKLSKLFGYSYLINHSSIGFTHTYLSNWSTIFYRLIRMYELLDDTTVEKDFIRRKIKRGIEKIKGRYKEDIRKLSNSDDTQLKSKFEKQFLKIVLEFKPAYNGKPFKKMCLTVNIDTFNDKIELLCKKIDVKHKIKEIELISYIYIKDIIEKEKSEGTTEDRAIIIYKTYILEAISHIINIQKICSENFAKLDKYRKEISEKYGDFVKDISSRKVKLITLITSLIEEDNIPYIVSNYQSEKSIGHLSAAIETHTEGDAYKDFTANMFYLNDDLNDNLDHFFASLERLRINSDYISKRITKQKTLHKYSELYEHDNYFKTIVPEIELK